jgi:signal transduction histidine kinase
MGTESGLIRFDKKTEKFTVFQNQPNIKGSISNNYIRDIFQDSKKRLWIGTRLGLNLWNEKQQNFQLLNQFPLLGQETINSIQEDKAGNLWVKLNQPIVIKVNFEQNSQQVYNFEGFENSFLGQLENGQMYLLGESGVHIFSPEKMLVKSYFPPLILTNFKVFDKPYSLTAPLNHLKTITLDYQQNFFSFEFATLDFYHPEKIEYAYRMKGFDPDWVNCGQRRYASYTNLDAGEYTFEVKSSNNQGQWNPKILQIKIIIKPPFWQTWWFKILIISVLCGVLYAIYYARLQHYKTVNQLQRNTIEVITETQEKERKRIAHELHDSIGSLLATLKLKIAKLLPSSYTSDNQTDTEEQTQLLRILDETSEEVRRISHAMMPGSLQKFGLSVAIQNIADELNETKGLRVETSIYGLEQRLEPKLEILVYRIIQELIQNTLKHAQASQLFIHLTKTSQNLNLIVEDNGKGLAPDYQLNQGLGLQNIKNRVLFLGGQFNLESKPTQGTTIIIDLPIIEKYKN